MKTVSSVEEMMALSRQWRKTGKTIGFVPTMGALHEGHLSLVRECRNRAEVTVVSLFVNPKQFGPSEDFEKYPRDLAGDKSLLEGENVTCLFRPPVEEVFPPGYKTYIEVHSLQDRLCGESRPGHFRGVATVVLKLLHIIRPDVAFFGWKDAQQVILLRRMVEDLNCDTEIVACPLIRESDGLALSSRNAYLTEEERKAALVLSRSLFEADKLISNGEREANRLKRRIREIIEGEPLARIDYIEIVGEDDLGSMERLEGNVLIALAVFIGKTRLIDNIRVQL